MAITNRCFSSDSKGVMTMEDFKLWLKKLDTDHDGRLSRQELQEAIRMHGGWFSGWKSRQAMSSADVDRSGFIDESEYHKLVDFAEKQLGLKIVVC